jgi:two-component sensor histidine kinase
VLVAAGLHLAGWAAYGVVYYVTLRPYNPFPDIILKQTLIAAGSGLVLSTLLGLAYRRLRLSTLHPAGEAGAVLLGALFVGWGWYQVKAWGVDWVDPFAMPVLAIVSVLPGEGSMLSRMEAFPIVLLIWSGFERGFAHWGERQRQQQRVLQADAEAHRARLKMLRYQLNPHFFFNALNTISALAEENPQRVKEAVHELSGFLRYSLLDGETLDVLLREEVRAARHYLAVEKMRFENDLDVRIDVDAEAHQQTVPAFLVLPLVENAVKHGQYTSPSPLRVALTATVQDGHLIIEVANTGHLRTDDPAPGGTGTGLANVRARLAAQYPDAHAFALAEDDGWVRARLDIETPAIDSSPSHA